MRPSFAAALFSAALVFAPAASAQDAPSMLTTVGSPLPYRIDLPRDWKINRGSFPLESGRDVHALAVVRDGVTVGVLALDLMEGQRDGAPVLPDAEMRRAITDMCVKSGSLLYDVLRSSSALKAKDGPILDLVREIRTLGGQRAAYMRGRVEQDGRWYRFETRLTVQDGIMYVLTMTGEADRYAAHEPLFARIRDSLVLGRASTPAAAGLRTAR
jgi:hypothetical protein